MSSVQNVEPGSPGPAASLSFCFYTAHTAHSSCGIHSCKAETLPAAYHVLVGEESTWPLSVTAQEMCGSLAPHASTGAEQLLSYLT